jgi:acetoin utilization protein AcuC
MSTAAMCELGISYGSVFDLYSFPRNPMNNSRTRLFESYLQRIKHSNSQRVTIIEPTPALQEDLLLFHSDEYVNFVKRSSETGEGYLNYDDTPSFKGIYEASLYPVGSTLKGLELLLDGRFHHFFNPIGGLHHAMRNRARGFCVFNDGAIAICKILLDKRFKRIGYIDIDAHHGDGVFYGFESEPRVIIGDIHEFGPSSYPGTGSAEETGLGEAIGTKLNVPLPVGAGDTEFIRGFDKIESFVRRFAPELIIFQCGADGLVGDPEAHLAYSTLVHTYASRRIHGMAHDLCQGRILALGGGGYDARNVLAAWSAVVRELEGLTAPMHCK